MKFENHRILRYHSAVKITRSTKCRLNYTTKSKRQKVRTFLIEYVRVVNLYIDAFWFNSPGSSRELTKELLDRISDTWLSQRAKQCAARQAIGRIKSARLSFAEKQKDGKCKSTPKKPRLRKLQAELSSNCVEWQTSRHSSFDVWLHIHSLGNKESVDVPVNTHKHYRELAEIGERGTTFVVTPDYVQIPFEIDVGKKLPPTGCLGVDTGINALAATSIGEQFGTEVKEKIERVKRCKHGSKGQQRARRCLRHYIDTVVKQVMLISSLTLIVIENLKGITQNTKNPKRRLGKNMRRSIGAWNVRYWLKRLEMACERNRVSFRTVSAFYTSRTCPACGHCQKENRNGLLFKCLQCGYTDNADISASKITLNRHLTGKFGKGCIGLPDRRKDFGLTISPNSLLRRRDNAARQRDQVKYTKSR